MKAARNDKFRKKVLGYYGESPFFLYLLEIAANPLHIIYCGRLPKYKFTGELDLIDVEEEVRDLLTVCEISTDSAKNALKVSAFLEYLLPESADLLRRVIKKRLDCGVGQRVILNTFPGMFQYFTPQKKSGFFLGDRIVSGNWIYCEDLEGCEVVGIFQNKKWRLLTNRGVLVQDCDYVDADLEQLRTQGVTFFSGVFHLPGHNWHSMADRVARSLNTELTPILYLYVCGNINTFFKRGFLGYKILTGAGKYVTWIKYKKLLSIDKLEGVFLKSKYKKMLLRNTDRLYSYGSKIGGNLLSVTERSFFHNYICEVVDTCVIEEVGVKLLLNITIKIRGENRKVYTGFTVQFKRSAGKRPDLLLGRHVSIKGTKTLENLKFIRICDD
jgi:hypothetical protein